MSAILLKKCVRQTLFGGLLLFFYACASRDCQNPKQAALGIGFRRAADSVLVDSILGISVFGKPDSAYGSPILKRVSAGYYLINLNPAETSANFTVRLALDTSLYQKADTSFNIGITYKQGQPKLVSADCGFIIPYQNITISPANTTFANTQVTNSYADTNAAENISVFF